MLDCEAPSLLESKLAKAADLGAGVAVIDTPPHADAMARRAANLADLFLIPCRPRAFDLAAIEATAELVRASGRPAFVVFNAGPPRAPLIYREASGIVAAGFGLPVAAVLLADRAGFHHSAAAGLTAPEYSEKGKAAAEAQALWAWTCEQLDKGAGVAVRRGRGECVSRFASIKTARATPPPPAVAEPQSPQFDKAPVVWGKGDQRILQP